MGERALVLVNADVRTQWAERPRAKAVRMDGGRVAEVGDRVRTDGAEVIDLGGRTVLPGFVDAHVHLLGVGMAERSVDLAGAASKAEALQRIAERAGRTQVAGAAAGVLHSELRTPDSELPVLRAVGWDESQWVERQALTRADLDRVAPGRAVLATRVCGHVRVASSAAVAAICRHCGLDEAALARIGLDPAAGTLTGQAAGHAHAFAEPDEAERLAALAAGCAAALRCGITFVHDLSDDAALFRALHAEGRLPLRACVAAHPKGGQELPPPRIGPAADELLREGPVKLFADGSLGAYTAALRSAYADRPGCTGQLYTEPALLARRIAAAHAAGRQAACHAIGDRGIDVLLDAFESALGDRPAAGRRHRVEHCEMPDAAAIARMRRLGLIASVQPNFAGRWQRAGGLYETRLGAARAAGLNPFADLAAAGVPLAFGSDGMPIGPLYGIASAVTHPNPAQRMSAEEAIRCYTLGGAFAAFAEREIGRLAPGFLADAVVVSADPTGVPAEEIGHIRIDATILAGRLAHRCL